jgi:uncharacterized protein (DUF1778 family)
MRTFREYRAGQGEQELPKEIGVRPPGVAVHFPYNRIVATKTRRIEMRADPESEQRIMAAAKLAHEPVSTFILEAALSAADRLLGRTDTTLMPAEQFDALMASLDTPDYAPGLSRIGAQPSRFERG